MKLYHHSNTLCLRIAVVVTLLLSWRPVIAQYDLYSSFSISPITQHGLSSVVVRAIVQDDNGLVWVGTDLGLYRYDGYQTFKISNNLTTPHALTSNRVTCMAIDRNQLWVGTQSGLNSIDLRTYNTRQYRWTDYQNSQRLNDIYVAPDGAVWASTESGLYRKKADKEQFEQMGPRQGAPQLPRCAVKNMEADSKGHLWLGTWSDGIYRYDAARDQFTLLPGSKELGPSLYLHLSPKGTLLVGTWEKGLQEVLNPLTTKQTVTARQYTTASTHGQLADNYTFSFCSDPRAERLWIGTSQGLSVLTYEGSEPRLERVSHNAPDGRLLNQGMVPLLCDRRGNVWVHSQPVGLMLVSPRSNRFVQHHIPLLRDDETVLATTFDHEGNQWFALHSEGLCMRRKSDGRFVTFSEIPAMRGKTVPLNVGDIMVRANGNIEVATPYDGWWSVSADLTTCKQYLPSTMAALPTENVLSLAEDAHRRLLIGTTKGLTVVYADGRAAYLNNKHLQLLTQSRVQHILPARDGSLWLSTIDKGLLHLTGDLQRPATLRVKQYNKVEGSAFRLADIGKTLEDQNGTVWVCSEEAGLMRYDKRRDALVDVGRNSGITDEVTSMEVDRNNRLWVSTHSTLLYTQLKGVRDTLQFRYAHFDFAQPCYFAPRMSACSPQGSVSFGGLQSYLEVRNPDGESIATFSPCITDIIVNGQPLSLHVADHPHDKIMLPPYTDNLVLEADENDLRLQFSAFSYQSQSVARYSYRLVGYDNDWTYTDDGVNSAHYTNLDPGTYIFELRAIGEDDNWKTMTHSLEIRILTPLYLRWWALLIYFILFFSIGYIILRQWQERLNERRSLQLAQLETRNIEELNRKKLEFFTNITHDLTTPLAVISAAIDHAFRGRKDLEGIYHTIQGNLNKEMRLIQQILEFRKAETGNLKLRVSEGDLSAFCRTEVDNVRPLLSHKKLHLSMLSEPDTIVGYFDTDALDKIIYNLLSNAVKYTPEMGFVHIDLTERQTERGRMAVFTIKDSGKGLTDEQQRHIFDRFQEGEHRKNGTYGTGIGLNLTKTLVTLHHGEITLQSTVGEGTTFTVMLPIDREAFAEQEIESSLPTSPQGEENSPRNDIDSVTDNGMDKGAALPLPSGRGQEGATLLVVEDEEDLNALMCQLLESEYNVLHAYDGQEALEVLEKHHADVIITDVMMPQMDGIALTKALRGDARWRNTPVIVLTAKRDEQAHAEAYEAGADAYLTKPFNLSILQARIQNLLNKSNNVAEEIRSRVFDVFGELKLDNDDEVFLTRCIAVVNENLENEEFGQEEFAQAMGVSKSTLYKKLKAITDLSTSSFIRSIRMQAACNILRKKPSIRISDLAYSVGYSSPKYFSTCFKADFGMLPTEYADKIEKEK